MTEAQEGTHRKPIENSCADQRWTGDGNRLSSDCPVTGLTSALETELTERLKAPLQKAFAKALRIWRSCPNPARTWRLDGTVAEAVRLLRDRRQGSCGRFLVMREARRVARGEWRAGRPSAWWPSGKKALHAYSRGGMMKYALAWMIDRLASGPSPTVHLKVDEATMRFWLAMRLQTLLVFELGRGERGLWRWLKRVALVAGVGAGAAGVRAWSVGKAMDIAAETGTPTADAGTRNHNASAGKNGALIEWAATAGHR